MKTTENQAGARVLTSMVALALGGLVLGAGCGDDSGGSGGAGGAGGGGTTSGTSQASTSGSPASSGATNATTTSSVGPGGGEGGSGEGGSGQGGGTGGSGGGGGGFCFDDDAFADLFTLETDRLCVVALYDAPDYVADYASQPTWGLHRGLLTGEYFADEEFGPITSLEVTRWTTPNGTTGELAGETTEIDFEDTLGDDARFGGAQLVELDDDVMIFAYTGFEPVGGMVFFDEEGAVEQDALIGGFSIGIDPSTGLSIYTSLAAALAIEVDEDGGAGLYGSEPCDEGGFVCGGAPLSRWGDNNGPLAIDGDGNVFAVMTSLDGTQTARAFSSTQIEIGGETDGVDFFTIDGYGSPLGALARSEDADGLLAFQATEVIGDGKDAEYIVQDPIVVPYTTGDGAIVSTGEPETLLTLATEGTNVSIVADDEDRLWIGVPSGTGTRYAVLARP